jgi:hypothetical protein
MRLIFILYEWMMIVKKKAKKTVRKLLAKTGTELEVVVEVVKALFRDNMN